MNKYYSLILFFILTIVLILISKDNYVVNYTPYKNLEHYGGMAISHVDQKVVYDYIKQLSLLNLAEFYFSLNNKYYSEYDQYNYKFVSCPKKLDIITNLSNDKIISYVKPPLSNKTILNIENTKLSNLYSNYIQGIEPLWAINPVYREYIKMKKIDPSFLFYEVFDRKYYYNQDTREKYSDDPKNELNPFDTKIPDIFDWKINNVETFIKIVDTLHTKYGQYSPDITLDSIDQKTSNIINTMAGSFNCKQIPNNMKVPTDFTRGDAVLSYDKTLLDTAKGMVTSLVSDQYKIMSASNITKLFTPEQVEYILYFQYYGKFLVYNIFNEKWQYRNDLDIKHKIDNSKYVNSDIIIFPVLANHGIFVTLIFDKRFGLIVASKGTESKEEWSNNFNEDGVATRVIINNFNHVLNSIEYICKKYNEQNNGNFINNIAFTGHSLGGAISQTLAALFVHNYKQNNNLLCSHITNLHLVTFNSAGVIPLIVNKSVDWLIECDIILYDIIIRRKEDIVHSTGWSVFQCPELTMNENEYKDKVNRLSMFYTPKKVVSSVTNFITSTSNLFRQKSVSNLEEKQSSLLPDSNIQIGDDNPNISEKKLNQEDDDFEVINVQYPPKYENYKKISNRINIVLLMFKRIELNITIEHYTSYIMNTAKLLKHHTRFYFNRDEDLKTYLTYGMNGADFNTLQPMIKSLNHDLPSYNDEILRKALSSMWDTYLGDSLLRGEDY